jgi:hypothetical protein
MHAGRRADPKRDELERDLDTEDRIELLLGFAIALLGGGARFGAGTGDRFI